MHAQPFTEYRFGVRTRFGIEHAHFFNEPLFVTRRRHDEIFPFRGHLNAKRGRNIDSPSFEVLFKKQIEVVQTLRPDTRAAVGTIDDCLIFPLFLAADTAVRVVRAVVVKAVVVTSAEHKNGAFDEGGVGLRFYPCNIAVLIVA